MKRTKNYFFVLLEEPLCCNKIKAIKIIKKTPYVETKVITNESLLKRMTKSTSIKRSLADQTDKRINYERLRDGQTDERTYGQTDRQTD